MEPGDAAGLRERLVVAPNPRRRVVPILFGIEPRHGMRVRLQADANVRPLKPRPPSSQRWLVHPPPKLITPRTIPGRSAAYATDRMPPRDWPAIRTRSASVHGCARR